MDVAKTSTMLSLPFRELSTASGTAETVFFAFNFPGVAGQETVFAECRFSFGIEPFDGPRNTEFAGVRLAGRSAAGDMDQDVDLILFASQQERREDGVPQLRRLEELLQFTTVDADFAATGPDPDPCDRRFAPSGTETVGFTVAFNDKVAEFNHSWGWGVGLRCGAGVWGVGPKGGANPFHFSIPHTYSPYFIGSSNGCGC